MAEAIALEDLIDQYKVEQHVAEKRYTDLYLAYDVDEDRLVDLDILQPAFSQQASLASRFVQRANAIGQIRHPNIPRVYGVGETSTDLPYVAQQHFDGYPLSERLAQLAKLDTQVNSIYALKLVRQLVQALLLASRLDLLHYDLRPHNVLLKNVTLPSDDSVLLTDLYIPFEPRKWQDDGDTADLAFLSPEQRSGKQIDAASHVYSLGALLYQLLAGQTPPGAVGLGDALARRMTAGVSPLEQARPGLSAPTYYLVDRSLRKDAGQRYETIEQFAVALEEALVAEEARIGSAVVAVDGQRRRIWAWLAPLLITSLMIVATVLAVAMVRGRPEEPALSAAIAEVATATLAAEAGVAGGDGGSENAAGAENNTDDSESGNMAVVVAPEEPTATVTAAPTETVPPSETPTVAPTATSTPEPTNTATIPPTMTSTPVPRVGVALNSAFLRRGPGTFYSQVGVLRNGEEVEILALWGDRETGWYLVLTADGQIAWLAVSVTEPVSDDFLDALPTPATIPPSPTPTLTPTATATPTQSATSTPLPAGSSGGNDGGGQPPATSQPPATEPPPDNPTRTPPPLDG